MKKFLLIITILIVSLNAQKTTEKIEKTQLNKTVTISKFPDGRATMTVENIKECQPKEPKDLFKKAQDKRECL